jgi:hypothetical protein
MFGSNLKPHVFRFVLLISLGGMIVLGLGSASRFSSARPKPLQQAIQQTSPTPCQN